MRYPSTKPKNIDYFRVPRPLWRKIKRLLPKPPGRRGPRRPPADTRAIITGIWYVLWTGCQWKAVHRTWFGVCSSVIHDRFQVWEQEGRFAKMMEVLLRFYNRTRRIQWTWQSIDSRSAAAPLGGQATGKNPTDRARGQENRSAGRSARRTHRGADHGGECGRQNDGARVGGGDCRQATDRKAAFLCGSWL